MKTSRLGGGRRRMEVTLTFRRGGRVVSYLFFIISTQKLTGRKEEGIKEDKRAGGKVASQSNLLPQLPYPRRSIQCKGWLVGVQGLLGERIGYFEGCCGGWRERRVGVQGLLGGRMNTWMAGGKRHNHDDEYEKCQMNWNDLSSCVDSFSL